ncbi:hypothetical protein ACQYWQ_10495 [Streptomyces sp. P6-2-1]|uniref:hypothetical protein n=1 Tax=Streptomyces sp. P6-2-1 TaxID=3422591 RepID=UPI003D3689CB
MAVRWGADGAGPSAREGRRGCRTAAVRASGAFAGLVLLLAGCGIRPTEVPTDAGPAPSRLPCVLDEDSASQPPRTTPAKVYLVCGAQLVVVNRYLSEQPAPGPVAVARQLLDQLLLQPSEAERLAHFTSAVPSGTALTGPRPGDPAHTLRLSVDPAALTSPGLAQLVCTLGESAAATARDTVLLGGPGSSPVRAYACDRELRANPAHTPVPTVPTMPVG